MKNSSVLKLIEEKPARLFKRIWENNYAQANFFTNWYRDDYKKWIDCYWADYSINEKNLICLISCQVRNMFQLYDIDLEIGLEVYKKYKERLNEYLRKKWEEHHKEWMANDKRDRKQLFQEAVMRGFTARENVNFKRGRWYIKFHLGQLYYPKSFKYQSAALNCIKNIGILGYTGAEKCLK